MNTFIAIVVVLAFVVVVAPELLFTVLALVYLLLDIIVSSVCDAIKNKHKR